MKFHTKPITQHSDAGVKPWNLASSRHCAAKFRIVNKQDVDFCLYHCPHSDEADCYHDISACKRESLRKEISKCAVI